MASGLYGEVFYRIAKGTLTLDGLNVKMMLLSTSASFNAAHIWASQISGYEITCTNYGRGYGGSGRKAMTLSVTKAADGKSAIVHLPANITWASLGGAVNTTVGAAAIFIEGTSDANSLLVGFFDIDNTTTIGTDFTLVITDSPGGNITLGNSQELDGTTNDTIGDAAIYRPGTSDANSELVAYLDLDNTETNGNTFTMTPASNGNIILSS